ncbi:MAG TPA: ABC transporter permease [Bryobacteraceae bacterium]|nr:ABC transporter permease [Bryobacteraceae bacterium]
MKSLRAWLVRLSGLWTAARRDHDMSDELESHLQMHIDDNIRAGMPPAEARRAAILKLGGIEPIKEAWRDRRGVPVLENLARDTRYAIRQLRKSPAFTATAVLVLALGICASVAIFAFVDAALIRPLPYRDPARLVGLFEQIPLCPQCPLSYPDYLDWKRLNKVFTSVEAFEGTGVSLRTDTGAEMAQAAVVTSGFFRTLGIAPILGRDFRAGEDTPAAPRTVLLSYAAWQKRYAGSAAVLGQTVTLNGEANTIIGVLPRGFYFAATGPAEFWTALHVTPHSCYEQRGCHSLHGLARLRDGVSVRAADSNMKLIAGELERQYSSNRGQGAAVISLVELDVGRLRPILIVLLCGAGLLLLIACVNVTSLLLVRAESRKREMAVRSALGGSRARLVTQFITEAAVLVAASGALGLIAARWLIRILVSLIGAPQLAAMPYLNGLDLNPRVVAFAAAVALVTLALFSLAPVSRSFFPDIRAGLMEGGRTSAGTVWRRFGANLVVLELATAVVLLVGAGLLGKSFYRILYVDMGMQPEHLATIRVAEPNAVHNDNKKIVALAHDVLRQTAALPGVESVALTTTLPVAGGNTMWIRVLGHPYHGEHNEVGYREVSAAYFTTLRAKLLRGRYFTDADDATRPPVIIIDRAFAEKYFPGEDPIGKQMVYAGSSTDHPMTVVGIVDNIKEGPLDQNTWPTMYVVFDQDPDDRFTLVVRAAHAEQALLPTLASSIHRLDPGTATFDPMTMADRINNTPAAYLRRGSAWLVGGFAFFALLLGSAGLYGVIAYSVGRRTREIGVRMALGARPSSVYRLVLKEAGMLIAAGLAIGLACSVAAAGLLRSLLFGVTPSDPQIMAAVAVLLGFAALLASFIPARRAASVNPVDALRAE